MDGGGGEEVEECEVDWGGGVGASEGEWVFVVVFSDDGAPVGEFDFDGFGLVGLRASGFLACHSFRLGGFLATFGRLWSCVEMLILPLTR